MIDFWIWAIYQGGCPKSPGTGSIKNPITAQTIPKLNKPAVFRKSQFKKGVNNREENKNNDERNCGGENKEGTKIAPDKDDSHYTPTL